MPLISLGHSPENFFTIFRKRKSSEDAEIICVDPWISMLSFASGKKPADPYFIVSVASSGSWFPIINRRASPVAGFSHHALQSLFGIFVQGTLVFHESINTPSAEVLVSLPIFNFALTLASAGMHDSLHSSQETLAARFSGP